MKSCELCHLVGFLDTASEPDRLRYGAQTRDRNKQNVASKHGNTTAEVREPMWEEPCGYRYTVSKPRKLRDDFGVISCHFLITVLESLISNDPETLRQTQETFFAPPRTQAKTDRFF